MAGTAVASSTPESQINYQSGAGPLVDLMKYFGGQKGAGTENVVSTGDTAALQRILATLNPADLQNLVAHLFSQGAAQVPALTAQFANATGTRVNNNTALAQSLALLQQNLAQAIAQAAVQQQSVAVNAAGKIADVNRTQQTQKQTQEGGNAGKSLAIGAGTVAGGHLLSKLGDKLFSTSKTTIPAPVATAPIDVAPDVAPVSFNPSPDSGMPITVAGDNGFGDFTGPAAGISSGIDTALSAGAGADAASTAVDAGAGAGDAIDYDFSDFGDDLFGGADFSFGFADGGMVRNRNYVPRQQVSPTIALRIAPRSQNPQVPQSAKAKRPEAVSPDEVEGGNNAPVAPSLSTSNVAAPFSPGIASAQGLAALAMTSNPIAAAAAFSQSVAVQSLVHSIVSMVNSLMSPTEAADTSASIAVGPNGDPNSGVAGTGVGNASTAGMGLGGPGSTEGIADASDAIGGLGGIGTGEGGLGVDASVDSGVDASSVGIGGDGVGPGDGSSDGDGDGGAAADGADGTGLKDGGYIRPRNSMQLGIDKIPARLSPAEYVLPADVVSFIGKDSLDALVDMVHAPIKGGRNG